MMWQGSVTTKLDFATILKFHFTDVKSKKIRKMNLDRQIVVFISEGFLIKYYYEKIQEFQFKMNCIQFSNFYQIIF